MKILLLKVKVENEKCLPTKQHIFKLYKPTHDRSMQKSCFLAYALDDYDNFDK